MCDIDYGIDEGFDVDEIAEVDESCFDEMNELSELELPSELIDEMIEENSNDVEFLSNLEGLLESGRLTIDAEENLEDTEEQKVLEKKYY